MHVAVRRDKNREQRAQKVQEQGTEGTEEQAADDNHKACRDARQVWYISRQAQQRTRMAENNCRSNTQQQAKAKGHRASSWQQAGQRLL